jgi:hypothetical protein
VEDADDPDDDEPVFLDPIVIKLAVHFRENWEDMHRVQLTRYLAALAVDFLRPRKEEF